VSPRNSSQTSVSEKGKKSISSPRHTLPILPNVSSDAKSQSSAPLAAGGKRVPTQFNADSHAAKLARMEAPAPRGYGGGIPPRIDEATESE
jgi:hypothetical protein